MSVAQPTFEGETPEFFLESLLVMKWEISYGVNHGGQIDETLRGMAEVKM